MFVNRVIEINDPLRGITDEADILLFLFLDSQLHPGYQENVWKSLSTDASLIRDRSYNL